MPKAIFMLLLLTIASWRIYLENTVTDWPKNNQTLIVAHRGGIFEGIPENSEEAVKKSLALGVSIIELDIWRTTDGVLIAHHGTSLENLGLISDTSGHSLDEMKGELASLSTVRELASVVGTQAGLFFDVKDPTISPKEIAADLHGIESKQYYYANTSLDVHLNYMNDRPEGWKFIYNAAFPFPWNIEKAKQAHIDIVEIMPYFLWGGFIESLREQDFDVALTGVDKKDIFIKKALEEELYYVGVNNAERFPLPHINKLKDCCS